ncbi:hypothetical protein C0991_008907 [Blastosporella zonata]|nr:hypothetical protein C0991_008907 [Blastosporella zonata]
MNSNLTPRAEGTLHFHTPNHLCEFAIWDDDANEFTRDSIPFPSCIFKFPVVDKRYGDFLAYDIINKNGDVNHMVAWGAMKNAILRPHREAARNQARNELRREEKQSKKYRLEEAIDVDAYTIPSSVQQSKMTSGAKGKGRHGKKAANDGLWDADAPHYVEGMQQ